MSLIVTLTTISARLPVLKYTLMSLMDQSLRADRVVLCISREPYLVDEGIKELPSWLSDMVERKEVEVKWVENTGPYRKLIPVFRSASNEDWIVTCDDDVIYGPEWLSYLVKAGAEHTTAIVCGRARKPLKNLWGGVQSYMNWPPVMEGTGGLKIVPIGVGGVLYRKQLLNQPLMYNECFRKLAPKQDDLWFNFAREVAGTEVFVCPGAYKQVYRIKTPVALSSDNAKLRGRVSDSMASKLFTWLLIRVKKYMGVPVCDNDTVIRAIESYKGRFFESE